MHFEDFVIQITSQQNVGFVVKVLKSPAGEGAGGLHLPYADEQLAELVSALEQTVRGGTATRDAGSHGRAPMRDLTPSGHFRATPAPSFQQLGDALYRAIFSDQIRTLYDQSLGSLGATPGTGLRIKLKLDPADHRLANLHSLPWEMLHRTETQDFLGLNRASPIVRYLDVPRPAPVIPLPEVMRILVIISSPSGLAPLDLERERRNLVAILGQERSIEPVFLERASVGALRQALLEQEFHGLHFMGHGGFDERVGEGVLYFEAPDGGPDSVTGQALATKLKDFHSLGLIFLNACNTARAAGERGVNPFSGVANALVLGGLPAVLAMQFPISDRAAIAFSEAFYRRLANGDSVDEAVTEGRQAVHSANPASMEWGTPVLFVRVPDGTVFQKSSSTVDRPPWKMWAGSIAGLVLTLSLVLSYGWLPFGGPASSYLADGRFQLVAGQAFVTTVDGLTGKLVTVDILPDGNMRLNFEFENTTEEDIDLDFHLARTYLADDEGHRYGVQVGTADIVPGETLSDLATGPSSETVRAGGKVSYSLDFPPPREGARELSVALASDRADVEFEFFNVSLEEVPEDLRTPRGQFVPEEGSETAELVTGATFESDIEGLDGNLARVELLQNQRMRWNLEFFNRSEQDQQISLRYDRIYLTDEHGTYYRVLGSSSAAYAKGNNAYRHLVQRAVKVEQWLEFEAPVDGARHFRLVLAGDEGQGAGFRDLETEVAQYPTEYSIPKPTSLVPSNNLLQQSIGFGNNQSGLETELTAIELRPQGALRWWFSFYNRTQRDLQLGLNYPRTYLADRTGQRYSVRRTDTLAGPKRSATFELRRGVKATHWMDFDMPPSSGTSLTVHLFSPRRSDAVFESFSVGPLKLPSEVVDSPAAKPAAVGAMSIATPFKTSIKGLDGMLTRAELPRPGRLRLYFELFNRSLSDHVIGFDYDATLFSDVEGVEYRVLASDTGASSGRYKKDLQVALKTEHWMELATPGGGERELKIALASYQPGDLVYAPLSVTLSLPASAAPATQATQPAASFVLLDGEQEMVCTLAGIKAKLETIDRRANGRLRWHFELVNTSTSSLEIGFNDSETYLSDNLGNTYKVLASDTNPRADAAKKVHRAVLPPGKRVHHWFEFSGPINQADTFIAVVASHDSSQLRFQPVTTTLK